MGRCNAKNVFIGLSRPATCFSLSILQDNVKRNLVAYYPLCMDHNIILEYPDYVCITSMCMLTASVGENAVSSIGVQCCKSCKHEWYDYTILRVQWLVLDDMAMSKQGLTDGYFDANERVTLPKVSSWEIRFCLPHRNIALIRIFGTFISCSSTLDFLHIWRGY